MMSLLAGIGIGSIIAAIVGWFVAISNHRQAWINALRDDLAAYLKGLEVMHYTIGNLLAAKTSDEIQSLEKQKQDARIAVLFAYRRILLRLNRKEKLHIQLATALDALLKIESKVPNSSSIDAVVDLARQVLKREWEVTKLGPFAKLVMWWRDHR